MSIMALVLRRDELLDNDPDSPEVDALALEIRAYLKKHRDTLSTELILETIAGLGGAPSLIYDDNGHWTIGGDGTQNLPTFEDGWETKETVFQGEWFVEPGHWKPTIREALYQYLDEL